MTSTPPQEVHPNANGIKLSPEGVTLTASHRGGGDELAYYPHSVIRSIVIEAEE
jgi:hypothetical protein